jgi:two-component system sensor histidine kinase BaeS
VRRVPVRHRLITRLLVTSVLIAIAAIASTAWLAARTATRAISHEQGRALVDEKGAYEAFVGYAATHPDWSGASEPVRVQAAKLGRRITLMTEDRTVIADSSDGPSLRTARPSEVVDPLNLDLGLTGGTDRIDGRVVGPYRITTAEREFLAKPAQDQLTCLRGVGIDARIGEGPTGRPIVVATSPSCPDILATITTGTERTALGDLTRLTATCLGIDASRLRIGRDFSASLTGSDGDPAGLRTCLDNARRTQLEPYVAAPALLFVSDPAAGVDQTRFTLSGGNVARIAGVTGAVLLATILLTVVAGRRLVRPLRVLTEAADRNAPAVVSTQDEIGHLARALNDSAERRGRAEAHHRALVSDVAHELRTPLTNIRSWVEAAQDDLAPTDAQLLELLHEEAVLLQHIIDDLGDLAAADAGTLRIHPEPVYVRDVLAQVADSHRSTAAAAGVELIVELAGDLTIRADPVRLRQIIGNLVANAVRYTPAGGSVTLGATATTVFVRDTGVGIAPENVGRVFDRFWRADDSRSRSTGGSGLGLAIARKLAEAHGGTIEVESRLGTGTVFTVCLQS